MSQRPVYDYVPHHRTKEKLERKSRPVRVIEQLPKGSRMARFNAHLPSR